MIRIVFVSARTELMIRNANMFANMDLQSR